MLVGHCIPHSLAVVRDRISRNQLNGQWIVGEYTVQWYNQRHSSATFLICSGRSIVFSQFSFVDSFLCLILAIRRPMEQALIGTFTSSKSISCFLMSYLYSVNSNIYIHCEASLLQSPSAK